MAKRHHEAMAKSRPSEGHYTDEYARRTQEMQDAGMIRNDMGAIANMPQEVMIKPYPNREKYIPENLDDTIRGVDRQIDEYDGGKRDKNLFPKKV